MSLPKTLRGWIADAEAAYTPGFDVIAPEGFDWRAFCADTPGLASRLGEEFPDSTAPAVVARLEELAQSAYRGGYLAALSLFAGYDRELEPDDALERLVMPLEEEEAAAFEELVGDSLDDAEAALGGTDVDLPEGDAGRAVSLALAVRDPVREALSPGLLSGARTLTSLGAGSEASAKVLAGVVNVAVAVASFRYLASRVADEARGRTPLSFEPQTLEAALGLPPP